MQKLVEVFLIQSFSRILILATLMLEAKYCRIKPQIRNVWNSCIAISRGNPHRCNESDGPITI